MSGRESKPDVETERAPALVNAPDAPMDDAPTDPDLSVSGQWFMYFLFLKTHVY
jgi:hypothetical protein